MKLKKLLLLLAGLAVLASAAALRQRAAGERLRLETPAEQPVLSAPFDAGAVKRFEIYRTDPEKLVLIKDEAGQWTIEGKEGMGARKQSIEPLLSKLSGLRGEFRAEGGDILPDFSLTEETAFHFKIIGADDSVLAHLLVSPLRPRGTQNFVRSQDSDRVLVTYADVLADINIFSDQDKLQTIFFEEPKPAEPAKKS